MKILLQFTAFTALAALLFLGCGRADRETADSFASTLEGDALETIRNGCPRKVISILKPWQCSWEPRW